MIGEEGNLKATLVQSGVTFALGKKKKRDLKKEKFALKFNLALKVKDFIFKDKAQSKISRICMGVKKKLTHQLKQLNITKLRD